MKLSDLVRDEAKPDQASHAKVWANIGYAAMTVGFLRVVWTAPPSDSLAMLFFAFGGVVAGSQVASKLMGLKWGGMAGPSSVTTTTESRAETKVVTAAPPAPPASTTTTESVKKEGP